MKRILIFLVCVILFQVGAFAQTNEAKNEECVSISATLSPTLLEIGEIAEAVVEVSENKYKLKFKWSIAGGEIVKGQGTKKIKIRKTPEAAGKVLTVAIELEGLPKRCGATASATEQVANSTPNYSDSDYLFSIFHQYRVAMN